MTDAILERLTRLHPKLIDLGLERIERLLEPLGSPHRKLPPMVHVAGTNGKGSLVAYLRAMARGGGLSRARLHLAASGALQRAHPGRRPADRRRPRSTTSSTECEEANAGQPITFFEITTVAAFLAFARVPADLAILEVGMGGRYDATNVVDPAALGDHAGRLRPHRLPGRQARRRSPARRPAS